MHARRSLWRSLRRGSLALSGAVALTVASGIVSTGPAMAVGPYGTCTASPPSSESPPMDTISPPPCLPNPIPPAPSSDVGYTYEGSSTYRVTGYWYPY